MKEKSRSSDILNSRFFIGQNFIQAEEIFLKFYCYK